TMPSRPRPSRPTPRRRSERSSAGRSRIQQEKPPALWHREEDAPESSRPQPGALREQDLRDRIVRQPRGVHEQEEGRGRQGAVDLARGGGAGGERGGRGERGDGERTRGNDDRRGGE